MYYLLSASFAFRLLDIAVAVAVLLCIASLVLGFVRQPIARLWVIQCTLAAGLLLFAFIPMSLPRVSLRLIGATDSAPQLRASVTTEDSRELKSVAPLPSEPSIAAEQPHTLPAVTESTPKPAATDFLQWWQVAVVAYGLGASAMIGWLLLGQWSVWRLVHNAKEPNRELAELWKSVDTELQAAIGGRRHTKLRITNNLTSPAAVGIWKPVVLIPEQYLPTPAEELRPLLAHEWSHCARHDIAARMLAAFFQVVYYYQPIFWWLRRELRLCQEHLADDAAVLCSPSPNQYATQLFEHAQRATTSWRPTPVAGILEGRSELYRRIQMLVHPIGRIERRVRVSRCALILVGLFLIPQGLGFVTLCTVVAKTEQREENTRGSVPAPIAVDAIPTQEQLRKELNAGPDDLVGIVLDQDQRPVPGVQVTLWNDRQLMTDEKGRFRFAVADAENHYSKNGLLLQFSKEGYANHQEVNWMVRQRQPPVARIFNDTCIEGTVFAPNGAPAPNVQVRATRNEGPRDGANTTPGGIYYAGVPALGRTDSNGHYKLLVEPQWYEVEVRSPEFGTPNLPMDDDYPPQPQPPLGKSGYRPQWPKFRIQPAQHRVVDFLLERGVEFQARFIDRKTDKPVAGVMVGDGTGFSTTTDASGVATIPNLPEGSRYFPIAAPGYVRWGSKDVALFARDTRHGKPLVSMYYNIPFDIVKGMPAVTIELEPGREIRGRVLDPEGRPVAGATIAAVHHTPIQDDDMTFSYVSNSDGSFIVYLPTGDEHPYRLFVHDGGYDELRTWADGTGPTIDGTVPSLDNLELRLTRPGTLRGRLVNEKGEPLVGAILKATQPNRREYFQHRARSDREGRFEFPRLGVGKYVLHNRYDWNGDENPPLPVFEVRAGETIDVGDISFPQTN